MTDSTLSKEAKSLLDALALALPSIKSENDGNGNLIYTHKAVFPFVKPLLEKVGLPVWLAISIDGDQLILLLGLGLHSLDVEHIFQVGKIARPCQYYTYLQYIGFGEKRTGGGF
jgi:hypothetical protein